MVSIPRNNFVVTLGVIIHCCLHCITIDLCDALSLLTTHHRHRPPTARQRLATATANHRTSNHVDSRQINKYCGNYHTVNPLCCSAVPDGTTSVVSENNRDAATPSDVDLPTWIIQWSTTLRQIPLRTSEFTSAFRAEMADYLTSCTDNNDGPALSPSLKQYYLENIQFTFQDALTYYGPIYGEGNDANNDGMMDAEWEEEPIPLLQVQAFESAMQYVTISLPSGSLSTDNVLPTTNLLINRETLSLIFQSTIQRCSLIRTAFQIAVEGSSYKQLAMEALKNGSFDDIMEGGIHEDATWSIRLRRYGLIEEAASSTIDNAKDGKKSKRQARYGLNVKSPLRDERNAINSMLELVELFRGKVNLADPECSIYLFEGLKRCDIMGDRHGDVDSNYVGSNTDGDGDGDDSNSELLLARVVAQGPKTSIYAPKTRICITTTPLCPIASFALCNAAQITRKNNPAILDPFAGSCATLLAAAHITSLPTSSYSSKQQSSPGGCRSVGIEIANDKYVNRDNIVKDFETRSIPPPLEVIRGDCTLSEVRNQARLAIGGGAFDAIVTDPPYGIREAMSSGSTEDGNDGNGDSPPISPLTKLFYAMGHDRSKGTPLLKLGGRLAAFVPVRKGESLEECLPDLNARKEAGLVMEAEGKEQVLSDVMSRWLVSFVCV